MQIKEKFPYVSDVLAKKTSIITIVSYIEENMRNEPLDLFSFAHKFQKTIIATLENSSDSLS